MRYGYFDNDAREYVIDRPDVPVSWTNYLGVENMAAVVNHTAGGYMFYESPQYHRVTRFRPNGVPMDRPGFYVYLRDAADGDYWSVSWQPVGKPLDLASYRCRHGLSYSIYECSYKGIEASQTMFIPRGVPVQLWDVKVKNTSAEVREISVFGYCEFSFHQIDMDNQNFQMSLYAAGSSYADGIIEHDLFYEEFGYQYFTADFDPDGFDCVRDTFLGSYRTETNPIAVESGQMQSSFEKGGNHCGALKKIITLQPGEERRLVFMLGEGNRAAGVPVRDRFRNTEEVDAAKKDLADFWESKLKRLQVRVPEENMNTMLNTWNFYQSEINVLFSRFASFIEVGGRTGLGYRDTAQDAMMICHAEPDGCKKRMVQLCQGLTQAGYGLHLFDPAWFEPQEGKKPFKSPTVVPVPDAASRVHGLKDTCSDDALWLIPSIVEYIRETGEDSFVDQVLCYADGGAGTVYEHMKKILEFSAIQIGSHGICKGLRADWNDCLNLGGGESALVSCLHVWALDNFISLAEYLGNKEDAEHYKKLREKVAKQIEDVLWDGEWYLRGFTATGRPIGTNTDREGRIHLESNAWAILSGAADKKRGLKTLESIDRYLYTPYGLRLNAPSYTVPDEEIGFVTRVYPGVKENGSVFSHPNPWAWAAACVLGRGDLAMKFYNALCPAGQNDQIEVRQSEPYTYCQFIMGPDHTAFGRARHPFMTGSSGWAYYSATQYILGIRPAFDGLTIDPCIPAEWDGFEAVRVFRGATLHIHVNNPDHVMHGVKSIIADGVEVDHVPVYETGTEHEIYVCMGEGGKE